VKPIGLLVSKKCRHDLWVGADRFVYWVGPVSNGSVNLSRSRPRPPSSLSRAVSPVTVAAFLSQQPPQHVISGQPQSRGIRGVRARCVDPAPALSCTTMADGWCPLLCRATSWSLEEWRCFFSCFCLHGAAPRNSLVLCPALYVRVPVRVPLESQKKSVTDWIRYRQHGGSPIAGCN
jgi:hypothetical protein